MNFEKLLAAFDMGICADQIQREALLDLALLFVEIDGVETPEEKQFIERWVGQADWNSHLSKDEYVAQGVERCKAAIAEGSVEEFIRQRAAQLANSPVKFQAIDLVEDIVMVDGKLDSVEAQALKFLKDYLK